MPEPAFLQLYREDAGAVRAELAAGLLAPRAHIAPKFLYDALGSRLFEAITELPEYPLTRTERAIFEQHREAIAQAAGPGHTLVDLGAGSGEKAAGWFAALRPRAYVAVDISVDFLRASLAALQRRFPAMPMLGLGLDFAAGLALPPAVDEIAPGSRLAFYPGSSIGNFTPEAARDFLRSVRATLQGGALLIGVDLVKAKPLLDAAYDDPLQVTAAFNRNLLRRLNALLGCDAHVEDFDHVAFYDEARQRIEMHLQARRAVTLRWPGGERAFAAGERIHTENSYKYTEAGVDALLADAGYVERELFTDAARGFAVVVAR